MLGATTAALEVRGAGAHIPVPLTAGGQRTLAGLPETFGEALPVRVYLLLEHVRGTRDATVLNAYVDQPGAGSPQRAGSVGLYGLRLASIPYGTNPGTGLTFTFDITQLLVELRAAQWPDLAALTISIVPDQPLPDSAALVVGRVGLFSLVLS